MWKRITVTRVTVGWALAAIAKGAVISVLLFWVAEASFFHALIVAAVSATITGIFLIASVRMNKRTEGKVDEVRTAVDALHQEEAAAAKERAEAADERQDLHEAEERDRAELQPVAPSESEPQHHEIRRKRKRRK
jgi:hypothetical protein